MPVAPPEDPACVLVYEPDRAARDFLATLVRRLGHAVAEAEGQADLRLAGPSVLPGEAPPHEAPLVAVCPPALAERWLAAGAHDVVLAPVQEALLARRIAACRRAVGLPDRVAGLLESVVQIGVMLSEARDFERLLEEILLQAQTWGEADAGTLYRVVGEELHFELLRTHSLGLAAGGTTGRPVGLPPLPLRDPHTGEPNLRHVATYAAHTGATVNIPDAYSASGFDFTGTRAFDRRTGYRSQSFLTVPLRRDGGELLGVVQLINARDPVTGGTGAFTPDAERLVTALCRLAAISAEALARECALRRQLEHLRVEVDAARQARQVAEITDTDYFVHLQARARAFRSARG